MRRRSRAAVTAHDLGTPTHTATASGAVTAEPTVARPAITFIRERGVKDGSSPHESGGVDETSCTRKFFVPWAQRWDAVKYFVGCSDLARPAAAGGGVDTVPTRLIRLTPQAHPDRPNLYATKVLSIAGFAFDAKRTPGDGTIASTFDKAEIEVQYEPLTYKVAEDGTTDAKEEWRRFCTLSDSWRGDTSYLKRLTGTLK